MIGQTLLGYTIEERLGSGGMGTVYRARDERGEAVALKLLSDGLGGDPLARRRFEHECAVLRGLVHPRVIRALTGLLEAEGRLFFAIELAPGPDLSRVIASRGALPVPEAARIASDVLEALAFAHGHGVLHRDVKPSNVFVAEGAPAKLGDFGLAYVAGATRLTRTGSAVGTPEYMAPEQAEGLEPDERTDLYSVGVLLHEMLAGRVPFWAPQPLAILRAHVEREPPELPARVPAALARVVRRALAKRREDRFASASDMRDAIARALEETASPQAAQEDAARRALAAAETREVPVAAPSPRRAAREPGAPGPPPATTAVSASGAATSRGRGLAAVGLVATLGAIGLGASRWRSPEPAPSPSASPTVPAPSPGAAAVAPVASPGPWIGVDLASGEHFEGELVAVDVSSDALVTRLATGAVRSESLARVRRYEKVTRPRKP